MTAFIRGFASQSAILLRSPYRGPPLATLATLSTGPLYYSPYARALVHTCKAITGKRGECVASVASTCAGTLT